MGRLGGKVAFITGGARGVGRAIADKFAREGANIVICDIGRRPDTVSYELASADDIAATVELVRGHGREIVAEVADVRSQADIDRVVASGLSAFGKIDIVVPNAGIVDHKPFWEITETEWQNVIDICLSGYWRTAKAVAPHLIDRGEGTIVFIASTNSVEGAPNCMHYIAAKHGIIGIMRSAALELAPHNVRVNAVLPGPLDTPINSHAWDRVVGRPGATHGDFLAATRSWHALRGRPSLPAEAVADAAIWLASDEARHATGVELVIDAGHLLLPGINPNPIADDAVMP